jgi:Tol biopolymer transport system component
VAEHQPPRLDDLTDAVLDGGLVDWEAAELNTAERHRGLLRQLRLLSELADVYRRPTTRRSSSSDRALLSVPTRWGPLDVLEHVGRGSFGDVYRAWDSRLDRHVALKLMADQPHERASGSSIIAEGRLLARVRHPNVVTIYGADRIGGSVGLWMEFVHGQTLEKLLADRGAFGWQEASLVGIDLCRALSAVHHAGVVHRDIKTQNVVREDGGRLVLMDFGTGHIPEDAVGDEALSGTPLYLAPELFNGGAPSRQSDLYSIGVLLFHLVTRLYPVRGQTITEVRRGHLEGRRVWLRDLRPELSERFIAAVELALAPEPDRRCKSAGELEQQLLDALMRPGRVEAQPASLAPAKPAQRVARLPTWIAITVVAALAVAALAGLVTRRQTARAPLSSNGTAGAAIGNELRARRLTTPPAMYVGRPSPDGRYLTYVDLNGDLCAQDLATGHTRRLTNKGPSTENAESQIAISRDGHWLAYTWHTLDDANEIRVVGEDGAWPRVLLRRSDVAFPNPLQWSTDGGELLTLLELKSGDQQLAIISVSTGEVKPLRTFGGGRVDAALSPDGRFVAFERVGGEPTDRDIHVVAVEHPEQERPPIVRHPANDAFPLWTSDGQLIFVSDRTGASGLWAVNVSDGRAAGEPKLVARDLGRLAMPLGLTDSGALYYLAQNGMVDVFTQGIDLSAGASTGPPEPVAPLLVGSNMTSEWSRDGRSVAYVSLRGFARNGPNTRVLGIRDVTTGQQVELRPSLLFFIAPRWSPDGRTILVRGTDLQAREGLFAIDVATGRTTPVVLYGDRIRSSSSQWAPDGRAVLYDKNEVRSIVAVDVETGHEHTVLSYGDTAVRIPQGPGFRVSPDGRSIAYTGFTFDNNKPGRVVQIQSLDGGGQVEIARSSSPERVEFQDWLPDSQGLLLMKHDSGENRQELYEARLDGTLRPLGITTDMREVSLRSDGKAITYTAGANTLEVWVLEHFLHR